MTAWSHLPNAQHIDRVLASLRTNPEKWNAARDAARAAARAAAGNAARNAARDVARAAAGNAAWAAARDAAWAATRDVAWAATRGAARYAVLALIAWDDCAYLLDIPVGAVRLIASTGNHAAVLLLPAAMVFNGEEE